MGNAQSREGACQVARCINSIENNRDVTSVLLLQRQRPQHMVSKVRKRMELMMMLEGVRSVESNRMHLEQICTT